jgi:acyl-CoA hydrolase
VAEGVCRDGRGGVAHAGRPPAAPIDLTQYLRPADTTIWGQACAEPRSLTRALVEQQPSIGDLRCFLGIGSAAGTDLVRASGLDITAYGGGGTTRLLDDTGALEILPSRYSDLPQLFARRTVQIDVAFVQVTAGREPDTYHLALAAEYLVAAARSARVVIAELNRGAPHSPDAPVLHAHEITALVSADYRPAEHPSPRASETDRRIAAHVGALVEDGATLQLGIGALPDAIASELVHHRHLGVHSGAVGDALVDLVESGAITNARKQHDRGVTICGVLIGTARLFDLAHDNPSVALRDTAYTHDPGILATQPRLTAINAAIEVDLTGQINAEVAGGRYVGAAGGSLDFARGANLSPGGVPITVLRSTAGPRSTIVEHLSGPVTVPRSEAGFVVTEHGAVDLRGLTLSQRRERLIGIAEPEHRDRLTAGPPGPGQARNRQHRSSSRERTR